jgi:hypothetical protein
MKGQAMLHKSLVTKLEKAGYQVKIKVLYKGTARERVQYYAASCRRCVIWSINSGNMKSVNNAPYMTRHNDQDDIYTDYSASDFMHTIKEVIEALQRDDAEAAQPTSNIADIAEAVRSQNVASHTIEADQAIELTETVLYPVLSEQAQEIAQSLAAVPVAEKILAALGGNKFIAMTGAKNLISTKTSLEFNIPKNKSKANKVEVRYIAGQDLYVINFYRFKMPMLTLLESFKDLQGNQLKSVFTSYTGLHTTL